MAQYFQGLSEKGIDNARHDLGALLRSCAEEVEGVVYDHHQAFLEACQGVEDLEDKVGPWCACVVCGEGAGWEDCRHGGPPAHHCWDCR